MDVSLTVSQVSRVAVIGANGAGKSTAIKAMRQARIDIYNYKSIDLYCLYVCTYRYTRLSRYI